MKIKLPKISSTTSSIIAFGVLIVIMLFVLLPYNKHIRRLKEENALITSMYEDKIEEYKTKEGLNASRIAMLESSRTKDFLDIKSKDSTINRLQYLVKSYKIKKPGESATVIETITNIDSVFVTKVVDSTYTANVDMHGWIVGSVVAKPDSTFLDLKVRNKYDVIIGEKRRWFKKPQKYAEVVNHNPYTETAVIRSYSVTDKSSRINLGFGITCGVDIHGKPNILAGVGLHFRVLDL